MANEYISKQRRGGMAASKIEHQDSVGVIVAVELLIEAVDGSEWSIAPEGHQDIDILTEETRTFIQVKSEQIDPSLLSNILGKFTADRDKYMEHNSTGEALFRIHALKGFSTSLQLLPEKLSEIKNMKGNFESEKTENYNALMSLYKIDSQFVDIIKCLKIDTRQLLKGSSTSSAIFSSDIRKLFPERTLSEDVLARVYRDMETHFNHLRINRMQISKTEVKELIQNLLDDEISSKTVGRYPIVNKTLLKSSILNVHDWHAYWNKPRIHMLTNSQGAYSSGGAHSFIFTHSNEYANKLIEFIQKTNIIYLNDALSDASVDLRREILGKYVVYKGDFNSNGFKASWGSYNPNWVRV